MRIIHRTIVGAFIFSNDGYILLGKSRKGGVYKDTWIVPGGGIEKNETLLEAVKRETQEEVGIDISDFTIRQIPGTTVGESKKTLRDSGEEVLVKMTFYDFEVRANTSAADIVFSCDDDIDTAQWHSQADLPKLTITPPMKVRLRQLNYL